MDLNSQKEQFSGAYLRAVAATAGLVVGRFDIDRDRIDVTVASDGAGGLVTHPRLDVQLKCTSRNVLRKDGLHLALPRAHHYDLAGPRHVPAIIVAVVVPDTPADWVRQSQQAMSLRRCGYWGSLRGDQPLPASQGSTTVVLPRCQVFSVAQLWAIMARIDAGGEP